MRLAGHQPDHLPYLGLFARMLEVDVFAVVDHVQFERKSWQSRNRVRGPAGVVMLSVPVRTRGRRAQSCREVEIAEPAGGWRRKHWRTLLACYHRDAPHFERHAPFFENLYATAWPRLVELNLAVIDYLRDSFRIDTPMHRTHDLRLRGRKTALLVELCDRYGADIYVSGPGGRGYVDDAQLANAGVTSGYTTFRHPVYRQGGLPFMANLSAIDLLFHHGPRAATLLRRSVARDPGRLPSPRSEAR